MTDPSQAGYDAVIIGGGPAGLTAALTLSRYRHRVLVADAPEPPRNAASPGMHGMPGLEGVSPAELRDRVWREIGQYGMATRLPLRARDVRPHDGGGFTVDFAGGAPVSAATVLLATGAVDELPHDIDGFDDCWGRSVIHCPFCLGWENTGRPWGVVVDEASHAAVAATGFGSWTEDAIAIVPPGMPHVEEARAVAKRAGGDVVEGTVRRLLHDNGALHTVEFDDGSRLARRTLLWTPKQRPVPLVAALADELNLSMDEDGFVAVDDTRQTGVTGLYAAGDVTTRWEQSGMAAAAAGARAADAIHLALLTARLRGVAVA